MFTGIIDHCGRINARSVQNKSMRFTIESQFNALTLGESIAINGICLTVVSADAGMFSVDVSPETVELTSVNAWQVGDEVNLERALRASDRFGGHFVLGHVDGVAKLAGLAPQGDYIEMKFAGVANELMPMITQKGCIAVNGVSLTVNRVYSEGFSVMLVPYSLAHTNLKKLQLDQHVNIEVDTLNRMIHKQIKNILAQQVPVTN